MYVKRSTLKKGIEKKIYHLLSGYKRKGIVPSLCLQEAFQKIRINSAHSQLFLAMSFNVPFRKFSSTSASFYLSKICTLNLDPFLSGILSQQLKNDFEIFQRWLCRKIQLLLRLQSTYTDLDVHVIMFTQCFDVGNTDVQLWKENSLTHLLDFDLLEN